MMMDMQRSIPLALLTDDESENQPLTRMPPPHLLFNMHAIISCPKAGGGSNHQQQQHEWMVGWPRIPFPFTNFLLMLFHQNFPACICHHRLFCCHKSQSKKMHWWLGGQIVSTFPQMPSSCVCIPSYVFITIGFAFTYFCNMVSFPPKQQQ